jgi:uncharacterized phage protein (TIGR01671 family)
MRQIKFRAWDKERKILADVIGIDFPIQMIMYNHPTKTHGIDGEAVIIRQDFINIVFMQWTGLHDKNNREIYEGDILEDIFVFPITVDEKHGYRFMFGSDQICKANAIEGEVVGNIYENPELIKEGL